MFSEAHSSIGISDRILLSNILFLICNSKQPLDMQLQTTAGSATISQWILFDQFHHVAPQYGYLPLFVNNISVSISVTIHHILINILAFVFFLQKLSFVVFKARKSHLLVPLLPKFPSIICISSEVASKLL